MRISIFPLGALETNCYLVSSDTEAVAIDPGGDPSSVLDFLKQNNLQLTHILMTHLHFDHVYGVAALSRATGAKVLANPADDFLIKEGGAAWGLPPISAFNYEPVEDGEISLLGTECRVISTPGHTPGGTCYYFPKISSVFVGDTLFYRSVGRSDFSGGNGGQLLQSIATNLFTLPEETIAYPGHGPETIIADEKRLNPFFSRS